jgi:DNA repair exonuclease SbcCD ATPase subunit
MTKDEVWKEYNRERQDLVKEYKIEIHDLKKKITSEREKATNDTEKMYKEIIEKLKAEFDKEKWELFQDNLNKMAEVQELCKKKVDFIELQISTLKQNYHNEFELWSKTAKSKDANIRSLCEEIESLKEELFLATTKLNNLVIEKEDLEKALNKSLQQKDISFAEREAELHRRYETEKKVAVSKVYAEKVESEKVLEKSLHLLSDRYDALSIKFRMLESKKKDMFLKENQQTLQRLMAELNDRNKVIDGLQKEMAKLKIQIKYAGETMRIFTNEKVITATHKKNYSELGTSKTRPSSVTGNKTFKFN